MSSRFKSSIKKQYTYLHLSVHVSLPKHLPSVCYLLLPEASLPLPRGLTWELNTLVSPQPLPTLFNALSSLLTPLSPL
ncbi:hypothetical protein E2C01_093182 [Portunus trituberculatus]|uniref:Uncharacterized protein n=1 Tax=Portunus trituberculatus TaxID=210409 RepID=A0A5B7JTB5_PORTR|nr:hypothetical protein [Portunus trituberculatus]